LEINIVPVQKKGLTHRSAEDNVHLGTRKSVHLTGAFTIPSERAAVPESSRPNAAFEANSFKRRDLKKALSALESMHPFRADCV
jgi:hypothetical protein